MSVLILRALLFYVTLFFVQSSFAAEVPLSVFPMNAYDQRVDDWLNPKQADYDKPIVPYAYQLIRTRLFYQHVFSPDQDGMSPWSETYVTQLLNQSPGLVDSEKQVMATFDNQGKPKDQLSYGLNFRLHTLQWYDTIVKKMNLAQLKSPIVFDPTKRAIMTKNSYARALPTQDVSFYRFTLAGQGYPFDNLQISAIWIGTPIYVIAQTIDKAWSMILTPAFIAWVPSSDFAYVSKSFLHKWTQAAKKQLAVIKKTDTSILDFNGHFISETYVGTFFPIASQTKSDLNVMVPIRRENGMAGSRESRISKQDAVQMPWTATPHHFADLFKTLIGRPYGWGGIYFFNDCSQELRSIFAVFGIWLSRHSTSQPDSGYAVDQSAAPVEKRIDFLRQSGKPFMTIASLKGHVVLYIGNLADPKAKDATQFVMTYQNLWALGPPDKSFRQVIGKAIIFPLQPKIPGYPQLRSVVAGPVFRVGYLDQLPGGKQFKNILPSAVQLHQASLKRYFE